MKQKLEMAYYIVRCVRPNLVIVWERASFGICEPTVAGNLNPIKGWVVY